MRTHLTYPLVAAAATAIALLGVYPDAEAAPQERPAADCAAPRDPAPVADDPQRPLDPRDSQFAQKAGQRYRQWNVQGGVRP